MLLRRKGSWVSRQINSSKQKAAWGTGDVKENGCSLLGKASSSQVVFVAKWELFVSLCI